MNIHPMAIVSPEASIGRDVTIGPFCIIEHGVTIGDRCRLESSVVVKQGTRLGCGNHIFEGVVLGGLPQHLKMPERLGGVVIGHSNVVREHTTVHRATKFDSDTQIGDSNLLMVNTHVAHDCRVGSRTVLANNTMLAGHVVIEDRAFLSGGVGVHQFCRVGQLAMIGGNARVVQDIPPFVTVDGNTGYIVGLNLIGLRRNNYTVDEVLELKAAYRLIYRSGRKWSEVLSCLKADFTEGPAAEFHRFLSGGTRGFVHERRAPRAATIKLPTNSEDSDLGSTEYRSKAG